VVSDLTALGSKMRTIKAVVFTIALIATGARARELAPSLSLS